MDAHHTKVLVYSGAKTLFTDAVARNTNEHARAIRHRAPPLARLAAAACSHGTLLRCCLCLRSRAPRAGADHRLAYASVDLSGPAACTSTGQPFRSMPPACRPAGAAQAGQQGRSAGRQLLAARNCATTACSRTG
jgi:hypothetical protein